MAVVDAGLLVGLGAGDAPGGYVGPWADIDRLEIVAPGVLSARVDGVGRLVVPRDMGREIWDRMRRSGEASAAGATGNAAERPRPARV